MRESSFLVFLSVCQIFSHLKMFWFLSLLMIDLGILIPQLYCAGFVSQASDLKPLCASVSPPEIGKNSTWFLPTSQGCCEDKCVHGRKKLYKNLKVLFLWYCYWTQIEKLNKNLLWILLCSLKVIWGIWFPFV